MKQNKQNSITIKVNLKEIENNDVLVFNFSDEMDEKNIICLTDDSGQAEMKKVFSKLLELLIKNDINLDLEIADNYSRGLVKDVCKEYISELNKELVQVKENINDMLKI